MKIGLFFGSFNPIHIGHLIIGNTMIEQGGMAQTWFVVSPQNPFKQQKDLAHAFDRLDMVRLAIADNPNFRATDVEFHMPKPSYTIDTLTYLADQYPQHEFSLIIGEDNLAKFEKWKNHSQILEYFHLLVYPRPGVKAYEMPKSDRIQVVPAPLLDISATYIRKCFQENKSVQYLVHPDVIAFIHRKHLFNT